MELFRNENDGRLIMKKEFIMLVMAGMLLIPMGNVCAEGITGSASIGYMFPNVQSMVVLGSDALSGKVLSSDEIVGYSYIPWVVVDAENFNLPIGFNLMDFFDYGCDGLSKEDLTVKILVAQAYQDEGSTEFVEGLYTDVTSDPIIRGEGTYSYKIVVTKPGSDSPLSQVETGFFGVSPSVSSVDAQPVTEEVSPSLEAVNVLEAVDAQDTSKSISPDGVADLAPVESEVVQNEETSGQETMNTMSAGQDFSAYYDVWRVQGSVKADYLKRCFELINAERAKLGRGPLLLDQDLTKGALIRAAECNVDYGHSRPGGVYSDYLPAFGDEIICIGGSSPEENVNAWMKSGNHYSVLMATYNTYIGVGQVNNSYVCQFREDVYDKYYKPATDSFLKTLETTNRQDDVIVDPLKVDIQFKPGYFTAKTIDIGQTMQCEARILTKGSAIVTNYAQVVPSTVKWSSFSPNIASVDSNGVVTGLKSGMSVITGTLNDKTISYTITVSSNGTPVTPPVTPELVDYLVKYRTHVQDVGWQGFVSDGKMAGTEGRSLRLEGINIDLDPSIDGGIEYTTHVQNIGWQNKVIDGAMSGTEGKCLRLEGITIKLTGAAAEKYDIYYRTHTQNIGWMGWAKNGEQSGSAGFSYRLEGINVQLVLKGAPAPGPTDGAFVQNK